MYAQENVLTVIISASVPLILFIFLKAYGSDIVWPLPLILMMLTSVFNRKRVLIIVGTVSMITGIVILFIMPNISVTMGFFDYFARIIFYALGFVITININRLYIKRLADNEEQIRLQELISNISSDFVTVNESNLKEKIQSLLEKIGTNAHVDRSYVVLFSENMKVAHYAYEWYIESVEPIYDEVSKFDIELYSW